MNTTSMTISAHRFKAILTDPVKFQNFIRRNKKDMLYWGLLAVSIFIIYMLFSDGDFSFFLTLSAITQMFGFFLIAIRVQNSQSVSGLSLNTMICYAFSFFARLLSVSKHEGYLPYDSSGDFVYRISEFLALVLSGYMIFMASAKYRATYNWDLDRIHCALIIVPMFIFALLIHPGLNSSYFSDIAWGFSLYLESLAMFPQLYMFSKKGGEIESFTSHFVASQGFSRCFALIFWVFSYNELNTFTGTIWSLFKGYVGYFIMFFQLLQVVLFSDFLYEYIKSIRRGLPMTVQGMMV